MESNYATQHLSGEAALTKVRDLLKNFRSAMMVTIMNGKLHSRPMEVQGKAEEFNGVLWFFSDRESGKIEEIKADAEMSLLFQSVICICSARLPLRMTSARRKNSSRRSSRRGSPKD